MRVVLGRVALLLGVLVVAAMAWYGADALFGEEKSHDDPAPAPDCVAATRREARVADRVFTRKYFDKSSSEWLSSYGVSDTRVLARMTERGVGARVPVVEGDGSILLVTYLPDAEVPDLPSCVRGVPLVAIPGGRSHPD